MIDCSSDNSVVAETESHQFLGGQLESTASAVGLGVGHAVELRSLGEGGVADAAEPHVDRTVAPDLLQDRLVLVTNDLADLVDDGGDLAPLAAERFHVTSVPDAVALHVGHTTEDTDFVHQVGGDVQALAVVAALFLHPRAHALGVLAPAFGMLNTGLADGLGCRAEDPSDGIHVQVAPLPRTVAGQRDVTTDTAVAAGVGHRGDLAVHDDVEAHHALTQVLDEVVLGGRVQVEILTDLGVDLVPAATDSLTEEAEERSEVLAQLLAAAVVAVVAATTHGLLRWKRLSVGGLHLGTGSTARLSTIPRTTARALTEQRSDIVPHWILSTQCAGSNTAWSV